MLVAFDGSDGSGKSTQVKMLAEALKARGQDPLVLDHPTHFGLGKVIRNTLHVQKQRFHTWAEAFLYAADLAETALNHIKPALEAGKPVLMHRWWYSSCVYQAHIDGADWDAVRRISLAATSGITPDMGFITLCKPDVAFERIHVRGETIVSPYENIEAIRKAVEGFNKLIDSNQFYSDYSSEPLHRLDSTTQTPEEIHQQVLSHLGL